MATESVITNPFTSLPPLVAAQDQDYTELGQASSTFLFNRAYSFEIGTPSLSTKEGKRYTQLRIAFEIEKTSAQFANKAKIILYNSDLSLKSSADFIGQRITLKAGYGFPDKNTGLVAGLPTIFTGAAGTSTNRIINARKEGDITTEFQISDSNVNIQNSTYDDSLPKGTPILLIVNRIAAAMALMPNISDPTGMLATPIKGSRHCTGPASKSLTDLLALVGFQWNVEYGSLQIYQKGQPYRFMTTGVEVSQATGLIGVPNQSNAGDTVVEFTSLMNADLFPGQLVHLISETVSGYFCVRNAKIEGDSHGNKWQVTCQCLKPTNESFVTLLSPGEEE